MGRPQFPLKRLGNHPVAAPDIGLKRICPSCAAKFYDLSKRPIVCPKCSFAFAPEALVKMRRSRGAARDEEQSVVKAAVVRKDRDDDDEADEREDAAESEDEEEGAEEIKEVALDDETVPDPDLVEDEEATGKDEDKPEVVGDEVDLEEIAEDDDDDDEDDDTLIESVDEDDDVGDIIDKGDIDKD
jgi:uncharacterized protein (TIGR02300 family)